VENVSLSDSAIRKMSWRLLPILAFGYGIAYMDRVNISFASLQMNKDLHFSGAVYGLGGGLFFVSYALLEVPSNLLLVRFGARRWLARIMFTWGVLAASMMFVRTPMQFYVMRFLLGAAEAGFFPGVVFYLMQWFPATHRGRAITRFYIALPLSVVVMGALAGSLLNLDGRLGLAGWQWLVLVEGIPAVALSVVVLLALPSQPADAAWLTSDERAWIAEQLAAERATHGELDHSLLRALAIPIVWQLGICNVFILGAAYAFNLSAPAVLQAGTGWSTASVGYAMSISSVLGAIAMVLTGWHSDRRRERHLHTVIPLVLITVGFLAMLVFKAPLLVASAFALTVIGTNAVQAAFWLIPSDALQGRTAAIGVAAIGSMGMLGSFVGPWAWGIASDVTGNTDAGVLAIAIAYTIPAALILILRRTMLVKPIAPAPVAESA
jgi:ACS family tartrate transporter-like MFS transporter